MINNISRLGFHYYPNSTHYREHDLQTWLPVLERLGASWITLLAPATRAIPESFIRGLRNGGIQPILHFPLSLTEPIQKDELSTLFRSYARWGVRYVVLFDRPNSRSAWSAGVWARQDLVERFLDLYLPLAEEAQAQGLSPVFPPLEPGGDYWDTAFLQAAFRGIARRAGEGLLETLVLSAYAWVNGRPLNWGIGGPDRWPGARPYFTPHGVQDQMGFRIFDWYSDIARQETGQTKPVLLLRAGALPGERASLREDSALQHAHFNLAIAQQLGRDGEEDSIPENVLACNFWLLAADKNDRYKTQAWFKPDGTRLPVADVFRQWVGLNHAKIETELNTAPESQPITPDDQYVEEEVVIIDESDVEEDLDPIIDRILNEIDKPESDALEEVNDISTKAIDEITELQVEVVSGDDPANHPIAHYVLLPLYAWGAGEWDLELIQPLLRETHPTVGFSLAEARLARRVTVIGGPGAISEDILSMLRSSGSDVERILADGTVIAT